MRTRRSWTGLAIAALLGIVVSWLLLPAQQSSAQIQDGATMTVLRGQVAIVRADGSATQPAPSGTAVIAGDEIRTLGSTSALITFFSGTEIELEQDTTIAIERVSQQGTQVDISLKQAFGTTINRVQNLSGSGSSYRIDAGGAVALVRGTTFVVIGPITTSAGTIVIIVCGADCSGASSFAGCPLVPFMGYGVSVAGGRVESACIPFAVPQNANLTSVAFEAITTIEQALQSDTNGRPPGQVQTGQRQEIQSQTRKREEDDPPKDPSPTQTPTAIPSTSPPGTLTISINNVTQDEGNDCFIGIFAPCGTTTFTFTVSLSSSSSQTVTVNFQTNPGTAVGGPTGSCQFLSSGGGIDYESTSGTLTFNPGVTLQAVPVLVCADNTQFFFGPLEGDETFTVTLSNPTNATIANGTGTGTIVNDDEESD